MQRACVCAFTVSQVVLVLSGDLPPPWLGSTHRRGIGLVSRLGSVDLSAQGRPGVPDTELRWYPQSIDHFSWTPTPTGESTFAQRYFVHTEHWLPGGPIFFYCGNEANVELYVNATGLMWENAAEFGAALVFAEHRFYGESLPFGRQAMQHLHYLTMEQGLADYARLIHHIRANWGSPESAVIAFGGSYGGMLAAWLRMKYPSAVDGAISSSAPILGFQGVGSFGTGEGFWRVVTRDASEAGGAVPGCAANVRRTWEDLFGLGRTEAGRRQLESIFRLCGEQPLKSLADVDRLASMHLNSWDTMAMGNFPYPSNYLVYAMNQDPDALLPAFPVRAACQHMAGSLDNADSRLAALRDASGVLYNASGVPCYELPPDGSFIGIWDYQFCTEMLPQETYYTRDGVNDMFWPYEMDMHAINEHCNATFGVVPRPHWIAEEFGGTAGASNIVFTNGLYDPWSSAGVLTDVSDTAVAVIIPEGAHHIDLMFSDPRDPESVRSARSTQLTHIRRWIAERRHAHSEAITTAESQDVLLVFL